MPLTICGDSDVSAGERDRTAEWLDESRFGGVARRAVAGLSAQAVLAIQWL